MTDKSEESDDFDAKVAGNSQGPFDDFFSRLEGASRNILGELKSIWTEMEETIEAALQPPATLTESANLEELKVSRRTLRSTYLEKPVACLERSRPHRRILLALETLDRNVNEAVRALPETIDASWQDCADWLGLGRNASTKLRSISLRDNVASVLARENRLRARDEDIFVYNVSECLSLVRALWLTVSFAHSQPQPELSLQSLHRRWVEMKTAATKALRNLEAYSAGFYQTLPTKIWKKLGKKSRSATIRMTQHFDHWEAQIRSGEGELRLERASEQTWDHIAGEFEVLQRSIQSEREELTKELQQMADWLSRALECKDFGNVPITRARVVPAARRQQELHENVDSAASRLPTNIAFLINKQPTPPSREKWVQLYPENAMRFAWHAVNQESLQIFERSEAEHRKLLHEVERARDVVRFALELDSEGGEGAVGRDALENALDLLQYQLKDELGRRLDLGREFLQVLPLLFSDYQLRIGSSRAGVLAHIVSQSLRRGGRSARRSLGLTVSGAVRSSLRYGTRKSREYLALIGFIHHEKTVSSVDVRTYLPEQFVRKQDRELPAIYERLFRIEPVEDARFLVGRSPETLAILEARRLWERGRSVAVLLSGQRGSGKTSLLNCIKAELDDLEVISSEFSHRLTTAKDLEDFFRTLLNLEADGNVIDALLERPRVVIIEELERTFLKTIGGFEAIHALQKLIASTCHKTLWILAVNQVAFNFLDRAVGLSQRFTHKIQTASATRGDLETAIMVRHNLSGLRLRFSSRSESSSRWRAVQRRLMGVKDARQAFFDGLASQSTGVYRTALEMWLAHIESVEAGVVYLSPIALPDLGPIVDELDLDDLFTLVAILQHGSLFAHEHAKIFSCSEHTSNTQLEELISRELLETDPYHPGLRIRPEAMPVVKEALYRRNLL